ncbi:AAA family ATPase [Anabaena sp. FACHB-1237]|uniref:AAA family ATPase n=1 Tax=Anabaena sp. FACHB-1237 TaxID=2692769 RepID=UPI001680DAED|nr:AAA family ATPase [Anabaena sp. FACHB-1237]MBD2138501.1 AAA family ATPase [Anabaena sp. FACHB-1237]
MKIQFSNLGSIKETELDLRPLTVIIGPNNSNKTYIAYSTYALWQRAGRTVRIT